MLRNKVSMRLKSAYKVFLFINTNNKKERKKVVFHFKTSLQIRAIDNRLV